MYCKRAALAAFIFGISTGCSRQPAKRSAERLAVVRFENLGDASSDWMGRAFSEVIASELTSAGGISVIPSSQMLGFERQIGVRPISVPGISSERTLALLAGATEIGYGDYYIHGGVLSARLTLEDPSSNRVVRLLTADAPAGDVIAAASALAKQIAPGAAAYQTRNETAIQSYMTAMEAANPAAVSEEAARAIAADPNYGQAYRMLAGAKAREQDVPGALAVLADAARRGNAIPAAERARIDLESATLRNDIAARRQALKELVNADPADVDSWRSLGESAYAVHDYAQTAEAYSKVLALHPDDPAALNSLAYAYAYSGKLNEALASLRRYQVLRPGDVNALDSSGDVYLISGQLAEAEKFYLQSYGKDPTFQGGGDLYKAAMARLMTGDIAGADTLEGQIENARAAAHDAAVPFRHAEWLWITGRRKQGYAQLAAFAQQSESGPFREMASRADSELTLWSLLLGDRAGAEAMLRKAIQFAGPSSAGSVAVLQFLAQPPVSAAEWTDRANRFVRNPAQFAAKDLWLSYALLLEKQFGPAASLIQQLYASGAGSDESLPVLLAWTLIETGHDQQAADLLRFNPVPPLTGPGLFTSFSFPRVYYLRGVMAEKQGKREDAQSNYRLFLKLSGDTPLAWGEEQKAQKALAP